MTQGQSKDKADKIIEEIMTLEDCQKAYKKELVDIEKMLAIGVYEDGMDAVEASSQQDEVQDRIKSLAETLKRKRSALGVTGKARLASLVGNQFLRLRMNARALKSRIRDRLRQRKFELDRLERAYRKTSNGKSD